MQNLRTKISLSTKTHKKRFFNLRNHPFLWPMLVFFGLIVITAISFLIFHKNTPNFRPDTNFVVIISHDNQKQSIPTKEPTIGALLAKLNIPIRRGDRVEPGVATQIAQDNLRVNIYRAVPVTLVDGDRVSVTRSAAATPRSIVAETGLPLYAEDKVIATPVDNLITQSSLGQQVTIVRSVPVIMNIYGSPLQLRTHAATVGELLKLKNIKLGAQDSVVPDATTPVTPLIQIFVIRKGTQIVTVSQSIPAPVQTLTDSSLSFGTSAVRQQGSPGTQVLTYQVNLQNGVEIGRSLLQSVTTVQPVTQIVARGLAISIPADKQAVMAQAGIASSDYAYVDYIMSHEGGWCPTKVQGQYGGCPGYAPDPVPSYGGYGIGQATPGSKMSSFGADWKTSPVTQLRWATSYANGRYGNWAAAYNHWVSNHNW